MEDERIDVRGDQIEYEDQSPRIQRMYEEATRESGAPMRMSAFLRG